MNKKTYINPRSYVHEATLFINPSKKNNHNAFSYLDTISLVAPIGIFFGVKPHGTEIPGRPR